MERATQLVAENLRRYVAREPPLNVEDPLRGYQCGGLEGEHHKVRCTVTVT